MNTFRPLLIAWACLLGLLAGTAITLQIIGPPKRGEVLHARTAAKPVQEEPPASALPSTPNPAPILKMTLSAIPEPSASLQEPSPDFPGRTLPRIAANGRSPAAAYAAAADRGGQPPCPLRLSGTSVRYSRRR